MPSGLVRVQRDSPSGLGEPAPVLHQDRYGVVAINQIADVISEEVAWGAAEDEAQELPPGALRREPKGYRCR